MDNKFYQKILVHYVKCIFVTCVKLEFSQQMYGSFNDFATQLFCIFLKASIFSKTERKKQQIILINKFEKLFRFLIQFLSSRIISPGKCVC